MSNFLNDSPATTKTLPNVNIATNSNLIEEAYAPEATSRKIEFDRGNPLNYDFISNKVHTVPYSLKGFLIFIHYRMGRKPFNILLLFVLCFYLISYICTPEEVGNLDFHSTISFHLTVLVLELFFYSLEFFCVFLNDAKINNQRAKIYNSNEKKFIDAKWGDICVGNIVKVCKDEVVPADIIVLESLDQNHLCYLDYSSVNGVFDSFAVKKACSDTHAPSMKTIRFHEYVKNIKGVLKYEEPNSNMHSFNGRLKLESFPRASDVTNENFVLRGTTIKNIKLIYGLVVYTGMDTKIMQSLKTDIGDISDHFSPLSSSYYENESKKKIIIKKDRDIIRNTLIKIEYLLIILYFILVLISSLVELQKACLCYYSFSSPKGDDHIYLGFANIKEKVEMERSSNPFFEMYLSIVSFVLSYFLLFPFDWFFLIEIAYILNGKFIEWDYEIKKYVKKNDNVEVINKNCISDFGEVRHILTDKTGTLTSRKYKLKICSIQGKLYSFDKMIKKDENYVFKEKNAENQMSELEIYQELHSNSSFSNVIKEFFRLLCLCHTVKVSSTSDHLNDNNQEKKDSKLMEEIRYCSSFAEERAMLKTFSKMGYSYQKTKNPKVAAIQIDKEFTETFYIIASNKYTKDRRRMSVLVKAPKDNHSILLCKSNDTSIFKLLKQNSKNDSLIAKTKFQINELSKYGLRYFIFCKKNMSEEETHTFITKYKSAENYVIKSEEHLTSLAIEYENDFDFLGVLFFEEKISEDLKLSIKKLNNSGIKVWIASGDKRENVLAVGKNLNIYNPGTIIGDFSDKDKPEDLDIKMSMLLMQFLFPNEKISKMKTRKGINVEAQAIKGSKELTIVLSGNCFTRICNDQRNYQSLATLLSYCTNLLAYSFTSGNKYGLCQMIKQYASKNSRVLATGDGFNDFMMLKEADLSVGIRSREILQVRNTCDVIINTFPQIVDLILVHGTWSIYKIKQIVLTSFYANFFIVFPIFIHQNANPIGSCFYFRSPLTLILDIIVINVAIIFFFCFDTNIERSSISFNGNIYKNNFFDMPRIIFSFGTEFVRAGADSLLLYYLFFSHGDPINKIGENSDNRVLGSAIIYTTYAVILFKIIFRRIKALTYVHVFIGIITLGLIAGLAFVDENDKIPLVQGFSYPSYVLVSFFGLSICYLYERIVRAIGEIMSPDFFRNFFLLLRDLIDKKMFFLNFNNMYFQLIKDTPLVISKIDKISYAEVLQKIYKKNNMLDPALENSKSLIISFINF